MNFLNKLERKFGKIPPFNLNGLMLYIIIANAIVFVLYIMQLPVLQKLYFDPVLIMQGEVWRVITFVFIPPTLSPLWVIFTLYFYYLIGVSLEHEWGSFKFNVYYYIGMLGTIIFGLIAQVPMSGYYLNLTLFFAFARLFPDYQITLFFILPIKIKYLAWFSWAVLLFTVLTGSMSVRIAVFAAILNFVLFFGVDIVRNRKSSVTAYSRKQTYLKNKKRETEHFHQCEICGRTEIEFPNLEFRFCSKCDGYHEYCMEHLFTHEHVKSEA